MSERRPPAGDEPPLKMARMDSDGGGGRARLHPDTRGSFMLGFLNEATNSAHVAERSAFAVEEKNRKSTLRRIRYGGKQSLLRRQHRYPLHVHPSAFEPSRLKGPSGQGCRSRYIVQFLTTYTKLSPPLMGLIDQYQRLPTHLYVIRRGDCCWDTTRQVSMYCLGLVCDVGYFEPGESKFGEIEWYEFKANPGGPPVRCYRQILPRGRRDPRSPSELKISVSPGDSRGVFDKIFITACPVAMGERAPRVFGEGEPIQGYTIYDE